MKRRILTSVLGGLIISSLATSQALGQDCRCDRTDDSETILESRSEPHGSVRLKFDTPVQGAGIYQGSLCLQNAPQVKRVRLFMPDMGHGSSPTKLVSATGECVRVEEINFMMDGAWEILVYQQDAPTTTLSITL